MIRSKKKIYAEANDPDTVYSDIINKDILIVGGGNKNIQNQGSGNTNNTYVLVVKVSAQMTPYIGAIILKPNQVLGTDDNGKLVAVDRSELE